MLQRYITGQKGGHDSHFFVIVSTLAKFFILDEVDDQTLISWKTTLYKEGGACPSLALPFNLFCSPPPPPSRHFVDE